MTKSYFTIIFFLAALTNVYAQSILYQLHSLVGDTVDVIEKRNYQLFSEFQDASYNYAYITQEDTDFKLVTHFTYDSVSIQVIEKETLEEYSTQIQKFGEFYQRRQSSNSLYNSNNLSNQQHATEFNLGTTEPIIQNKVEGQIKINRSLQNNEERKKLIQQGFVVPDFEIDLDLSKKKKNKKN